MSFRENIPEWLYKALSFLYLASETRTIGNQPEWLYKAFPFLYLVSGAGTILVLRNAMGVFSGLMLVSAGAVVWVMRWNRRRPDADLRTGAGLDCCNDAVGDESNLVGIKEQTAQLAASGEHHPNAGIHIDKSADHMGKPKVIRPRRFRIGRKGELTYEGRRFACLIQDISRKGIFLICNFALKVGQELEVRFELEPGIDFHARIKVRHFDDGCLGVEILEADPQSDSALTQFLKTRYANQSKLPERRARL